jgi:hypothetical protein
MQAGHLQGHSGPATAPANKKAAPGVSKPTKAADLPRKVAAGSSKTDKRPTAPSAYLLFSIKAREEIKGEYIPIQVALLMCGFIYYLVTKIIFGIVVGCSGNLELSSLPDIET